MDNLQQFKCELKWWMSPFVGVVAQSGEVPGGWKRRTLHPFFKGKWGGHWEPRSCVWEAHGTDSPKALLRHSREVIQDSHHGRSCLNNLLAFCDGVTTSVGKAEATNVTSLHFWKAFDMVPPNPSCWTGERWIWRKKNTLGAPYCGLPRLIRKKGKKF